MNKRTPFIAGNWKMYKTSSEAAETAGQLTSLVADTTDVDIMIAPAFTALDAVSKVIKASRVSLGAQNLYWENEGAYTGEVSASMLVSVGCHYVIIGHSERRQYFGETDASVNHKIRAAIKANLIPVVCVGETEEERDSGRTFSILDKQVKVCNTKSMIESSYIINNFIKKGIQVCVYMNPYYSLSEKGTI